MKSILILIEDRPTDVISYNATKHDIDRERQLVIKFMEQQVCNIQEVETTNPHKLVITSKKGTIYNVSWQKITLWDESNLED